MIKTKYKIEINIDDDIFHVEIKEPDLKEKKELELKNETSKELLGKIEELANDETKTNNRLNEINDLISVNNEILRACSLGDKVKILLENKELIKERAGLLKEKEKYGKSTDLLKDFDEALENAFKFKSELLIGGADKDRLLKELNIKNIAHKKLWDDLNVRINEALKKK